VARVDELMALCDRLEAQLLSSRTAATALMEALVTELTETGMRVQDRSLDGVKRNPGKKTPDFIKATLF